MSNLKAIKREDSTSGSTNKLRAAGFIPAILYGGKNPNQKISIEKKDVIKMMNPLLKKVIIENKNKNKRGNTNCSPC